MRACVSAGQARRRRPATRARNPGLAIDWQVRGRRAAAVLDGGQRPPPAHGGEDPRGVRRGDRSSRGLSPDRLSLRPHASSTGRGLSPQHGNVASGGPNRGAVGRCCRSRSHGTRAERRRRPRLHVLSERRHREPGRCHIRLRGGRAAPWCPAEGRRRGHRHRRRIRPGAGGTHLNWRCGHPPGLQLRRSVVSFDRAHGRARDPGPAVPPPHRGHRNLCGGAAHEPDDGRLSDLVLFPPRRRRSPHRHERSRGPAGILDGRRLELSREGVRTGCAARSGAGRRRVENRLGRPLRDDSRPPGDPGAGARGRRLLVRRGIQRTRVHAGAGGGGPAHATAAGQGV